MEVKGTGPEPDAEFGIPTLPLWKQELEQMKRAEPQFPYP